MNKNRVRILLNHGCVTAIGKNGQMIAQNVAKFLTVYISHTQIKNYEKHNSVF